MEMTWDQKYTYKYISYLILNAKTVTTAYWWDGVLEAFIQAHPLSDVFIKKGVSFRLCFYKFFNQLLNIIKKLAIKKILKNTDFYIYSW